MGGNAFTKAIADTFKLNFEKAEKLKRTAPMSKYARQILQAMKPVFTDLASEIQRSLGFYTSSHSNVKLARVSRAGRRHEDEGSFAVSSAELADADRAARRIQAGCD